MYKIRPMYRIISVFQKPTVNRSKKSTRNRFPTLKCQINGGVPIIRGVEELPKCNKRGGVGIIETA